MRITRRHALTLFAGALAVPAGAQTPGMSHLTAYAFAIRRARRRRHPPRRTIAGKADPRRQRRFRNAVFTPQYAGPRQLWARPHDRGLMMIASAASNDFGGQEPSSAAEIKQTASRIYGVALPIAEKPRQ